MEIEFEEAVRGIEKEITIQKREHCSDCDGSGAASGSSPETCQQCGGQGQVGVQQGFFTIARTCPVCGGAGKIIRNPCGVCGGEGLKPKNVKVKVKVPAGIDHGQRLKLRGEGEAGKAGGPAGDLYVQVLVKAHDVFERHDSEILSIVPVHYATVVLGGEIEIPTIDGKVSMKIPAGTPSNKVFRLRGKGVPILGTGQRGDHHVQISVHVPEKISARHRELLEELKELDGGEGQLAPADKSFLERMKGMFS